MAQARKTMQSREDDEIAKDNRILVRLWEQEVKIAERDRLRQFIIDDPSQRLSEAAISRHIQEFIKQFRDKDAVVIEGFLVRNRNKFAFCVHLRFACGH